MDLFSVAVLAHLLDPVRALVTFAGVLVWRSPWVILVAASVSAIACETILTTVNFIDDFTYVWGDGIGPGLIACLAQAGVLFLVVESVRHRRTVGQTVRKHLPAMRKSVSSPHEARLVYGRPEPAE